MTKHLLRTGSRLLLLFALLVAPLMAPAKAVEVKELVAERALAEMGAFVPPSGRLEVRLNQGALNQGEFISDFWIDQDSGQFIANVVSDSIGTQRVWGVVIVTLDVPVPNRRLLPEEILTEADLTFVELPLQRLGAFAVQDAGELVGMQVRRMLIAGRPVPRQSVVPPSVVKRGEKVEIVFKSGGLQLTARGRALEDAYKNQVVQVVNLSSRKAIEGVAVARGVVEIEQ